MNLDAPATRLACGIASALGVALGSPGPLRARYFPAIVDGDVPWASVELVHAGRWRAVAAVFDLGIHCSVARIGVRNQKTALVGANGADAEPSLLAEHLAAWVRDGGLERVSVTAFDVACDGLPLLAQAHPLEGSWWRAGFWGEWDAHAETGASLSLGGSGGWDALVTVTQEEDGVRLTVGGGPFVPRVERRAQTVEALGSALEAVVDVVGQALALRGDYLARPFPLTLAADAVLGALRRAGVATKGWRAIVREHFPTGFPDGVLERADALGQHFDVVFDESAEGVTVSTGELQATFRDEGALEAALPALVAAARAQVKALTPDKLATGARYRAKLASPGVAVGDELVYLRRDYVFREGYSNYNFQNQTRGTTLVLRDDDMTEPVVLRSLSRFLQRIS